MISLEDDVEDVEEPVPFQRHVISLPVLHCVVRSKCCILQYTELLRGGRHAWHLISPLLLASESNI